MRAAPQTGMNLVDLIAGLEKILQERCFRIVFDPRINFLASLLAPPLRTIFISFFEKLYYF